MSNTNLFTAGEEASKQSDSYKFLMSRVPQNLIVPGLGDLKNTFRYHRTNELTSFDKLRPTDVNDVTNSITPILKLSSEESDSDSFTFPKLDIFGNYSSKDILEPNDQDACILVETDINIPNSLNNSFPLMQLERPRKCRKPSISKSCTDTVCCENAIKDKQQKEKVKNLSKTAPQEPQTADWNYFSLRRACFRGMSAYYKDKFNAFRKERSKLKTAGNLEDMDQLVSQFIADEFVNCASVATALNSQKFLDCIVTVLHSHRHKKNEPYIRSRDFTKIRQVLYSFSTAAKKSFLSDTNYAFVFAHFYQRAGEGFIVEKSDRKPAKFREELQLEFDSLHKLAAMTLSEY